MSKLVKLFGVKSSVQETVYFIARVNAIPPLIVRKGKIINHYNHHYYIDSGGEYIKRHEEEIWKDEDFAWTILNAAFHNWLEIYE